MIFFKFYLRHVCALYFAIVSFGKISFELYDLVSEVNISFTAKHIIEKNSFFLFYMDDFKI